MEIEIRKSKKLWLKQKYYSVIIASNGKITHTSEMITNLKDSEDTAISVRGNNDWKIKHAF